MVLQSFLVPQLNLCPNEMGTNELKFKGMVECKEVEKGEARQNLTFLCGQAIVSGETKTAELVGQVASGREVVGKCDNLGQGNLSCYTKKQGQNRSRYLSISARPISA